MPNRPCSYIGPSGYHCRDLAENGDYCYWHDDSQKKTDPDLISRLETRARTGVPMEGFCLRGANLEGIDLINHNHAHGFQLISSDLYRCNLNNAHLFNIDLNHSSLMKASLIKANLNCAKLKHVNLLGVQFDKAKLDHIEWDERIPQELKAYQAKHKEDKQDFFVQAEEIYRNLRKTTEEQGLFDLAGRFFQREMTMRRYQLPDYSAQRILSKVVDLFCGYGEEPSRVVIFSLITIFTFALIFFALGISDGTEQIRLVWANSFLENITNFLYTLYFSVVTFTTLGYGDLAPMGITRAFAAIEAFIGSFTLALFVVVFVKKMTR